MNSMRTNVCDLNDRIVDCYEDMSEDEHFPQDTDRIQNGVAQLGKDNDEINSTNGPWIQRGHPYLATLFSLASPPGVPLPLELANLVHKLFGNKMEDEKHSELAEQCIFPENMTFDTLLNVNN